MAVRLLVFDNTEAFIGEVADIRSLTRIEEINGEHSLTFSTPMELSKQNRVLYRDSQDAWHEYVITGVEQTHDEDVQAVGTYYCVWSLQYDLEGTIVKTQPGKVNPVTSTVALTHALAGTARWTVGSVTQNTTGGASMYYLSGWEALGQVVEVWGGEVSVTISVDDDGTILSRQVNLLDHLGSGSSVRRFDYSSDMQSIVRTVEDAPFTCRITPRGAAIESENGGYGRKIDITSVNGGVEYLEDPDVVDIVKLPDGNGGWEYPNQVVEFDGIEDPQTLYDTAMAHLHDFTRPRVSYEAEVVQLAAAGMNPHGIALGDAVDVVDRAFTPAGLRLTGRVTRAEWDDLDPANNAITIGFNPQGFAGQFQDLQADIRAINDWRDTLTTEEYISDIISRLNETVNATGGYTYLVEGTGMVTYDVAVTDPSIGAEASAAVEIRGGTIRIADSKDAQGNWEWSTVFTAGHIAGELVTAAQIITGYIGSAGGTYIDLDHDTINLGTSNGALTFLNGLGEVSKNTYGALEVLGNVGVHVGLSTGSAAGSNSATVVEGGSGTEWAAITLGNPDQLQEGHRVLFDANTISMRSTNRFDLGTAPYRVIEALTDGQVYTASGIDMGQTLDLHTTDVNTSVAGISDAYTQDYVARLRPSNTGGNLGIYLNEVGTSNIVHYLINSAKGRITYRTSSNGGSTWTAQHGIRSNWTSLGNFTGSNHLDIDLTDYDELMVVAKFSGKLFVSSLPKAALTTSNQEWWLGGGKDETNTANNGAARALVNVTTTRVTGVAANNGSSSVLGSTTFTVYAR